MGGQQCCSVVRCPCPYSAPGCVQRTFNRVLFPRVFCSVDREESISARWALPLLFPFGTTTCCIVFGMVGGPGVLHQTLLARVLVVDRYIAQSEWRGVLQQRGYISRKYRTVTGFSPLPTAVPEEAGHPLRWRTQAPGKQQRRFCGRERFSVEVRTLTESEDDRHNATNKGGSVGARCSSSRIWTPDAQNKWGLHWTGIIPSFMDGLNLGSLSTPRYSHITRPTENNQEGTQRHARH